MPQCLILKLFTRELLPWSRRSNTHVKWIIVICPNSEFFVEGSSYCSYHESVLRWTSWQHHAGLRTTFFVLWRLVVQEKWAMKQTIYCEKGNTRNAELLLHFRKRAIRWRVLDCSMYSQSTLICSVFTNKDDCRGTRIFGPIQLVNDQFIPHTQFWS